MNKQEAANFLGVGVRTLERWASEKDKLGYSLKKNENNRDYVDYNDDDLKRLKQEMQNEVIIPRTEKDGSSFLAIGGEGYGEEGLYERFDKLIGVLGAIESALQSVSLPVLVEAIAHSSQAAQNRKLPIDKLLTLSLKEASKLSCVSYNQLNKDVKSGKLNVIKIGRGRRVRRQDLETYVNSLYDKVNDNHV